MTPEKQWRHALTTIKDYTSQITSGAYTPEKDEFPLLRIRGIAEMALAGLWEVVETPEEPLADEKGEGPSAL